MRRDNSPGRDLGTPRKIAGDIAGDIESVRTHVGDSYEFYWAMQQRAMNYACEIRQHFGYRLFPKGAYASTTPAEMASVITQNRPYMVT
jgi:hypothetical protein